MQILRGTKWIHSFLFEKDNPGCFLFSVIFVGMRVVEHFSRSKMQIQLGIALKTGRVLKQNPWKAAKFSLSLVQRRTWPTHPLQLHCSRMSAKNFAQRNLCDKQRFCEQPNCKGIHQKLESSCLRWSPQMIICQFTSLITKTLVAKAVHIVDFDNRKSQHLPFRSQIGRELRNDKLSPFA